MSVQGALSGTVVSPFFDGIEIKAVSSKQPIRSIMVIGNSGGRLNAVCTRQPSHRDSPVNCQGLPTLRVGNRQERKRSYFQYVTYDIPRYDTALITRYGKMTAGQLSKAIQEADVRTLNGYAEHKQQGLLSGDIHTRQWDMPENDEPRNRWKYQGDVQQIAIEEHVAIIPLSHLIILARSDEAPPGWRTKALQLTPDATIKAVHNALEKVGQKIDPTSSVNKLTVSRSRHILASIISKHARRRELQYDIIHQERLDEDLENLEVAITHTNDDDNPIPITFDLTLMLLAHHIYEWIKSQYRQLHQGRDTIPRKDKSRADPAAR